MAKNSTPLFTASEEDRNAIQYLRDSGALTPGTIFYNPTAVNLGKAMGGTYTPDTSWNSFYQLYPQFHPSNQIDLGGLDPYKTQFNNAYSTYKPSGNPYDLYLNSTASSIDPKTLGISGPTNLNQLGLKSTIDTYNKIVAAPLKTDIGTVLQNFPEAKYWSDETLQAFADNYRLGLASIYDPSRIRTGLNGVVSQQGQAVSPILSIVDSPGEIQYGFQGHKYNAITDPKQIKFDPAYGLTIDKQYKTAAKSHSTGLIGGMVDSLSSSPLPTLALLAAAYFGLPPGGVTEGATAAGGSGATGLASLPTAGTWAQTAAPALGAGAGSWTLPSALTGVSGATTAAGGLTLADALAAAPGSGTTTAGAIGTGGATSGGLPNFDLPFQSPGSIQPVGESTGLGSVGSTAPDLGTGMITSPEGLSGGTTLGAATPGTTGLSSLPTAGTWAQTATPALGAGAGSWTLPSALTGVSGATTAAGGLTLADALAAAPGSGTTTAGGLASSSSITDWLGNVFNQGVDKFMSDPLKNTLNLVGGISSYLGNNAQAKALEDYLKQGLSQSDPFGSQRAYYMDRLKSTYTNPEGYLKSPEYSAISKRRLEALERADAAQGRRSQYGARTEKMHEFDLENLTKERAMLAQLAGSGINPSQVASLLGSLGTGSATAQANAPGNLLFMLNQIFGGK